MQRHEMLDDTESAVSSGLVRDVIRIQRQEMEAEKMKPAATQPNPCNWSKEDELMILKVLLKFKKRGGNVYKISSTWLEEAVKGKLDAHFTKKQLKRKVRWAREKFRRNPSVVSNLHGHHESRVHELSSRLWGTDKAVPFSPHSILELHSLLMMQAKSNSYLLLKDKAVITELYKRLNSTAKNELEQKGREIERQMQHLRNASTQFHNRMLSLCTQINR